MLSPKNLTTSNKSKPNQVSGSGSGFKHLDVADCSRIDRFTVGSVQKHTKNSYSYFYFISPWRIKIFCRNFIKIIF